MSGATSRHRAASRGLAAAALAAALATPHAAAAQSGCTVEGEWVCHATADGLHPDGFEQAVLWWMNRARQDPVAEAAFLAELPDLDPLVAYAVDVLYQVDLPLMEQEVAAIAPAPPAAFDRRLHAAAAGHAALMVATDDDDPDCGGDGPPCQLDRVGPAGFFFVAGGLRGSSFGFAPDPRFVHAAWNVDWGPFSDPPVPPGMFPGRPHRRAVMSDPDATVFEPLTNVGVAALSTAGLETDLGPWVVVANYANANTAVADHHDRFLVGTVWRDTDEDGVYDPGEGVAGVRVEPDAGPWFAVTSAGGGWAIPVIEPGAYTVAFSGGGAPAFETQVEVGEASVLVDRVVPEPGAAAAAGAALVTLARLAQLRRMRTRRPSIERRPSA